MPATARVFLFLSACAAAVLLAACGGGGGGGGAPVFQTQALPMERLQLNLEGIRRQYSDFSAIEIDEAFLSNNPDYANQPPQPDAIRLGAYTLPDGGQVVVWLLPEAAPAARTVNTGKGRFRVHVRVSVPAEQFAPVAAGQKNIEVAGTSPRLGECAVGWKWIPTKAKCEIPVASCADGKILNAESNTCECPPGLPFERNGICEARTACAPHFVLNESANQCECRAPNLEIGGQCQTPVSCAGGKIRNDAANTCECPSHLSFDRNGVCEAVVACARPQFRNPATNRCECPSPNVTVGGECRAPSVANCVAAGMAYLPGESQCVAQCGLGFRNASGECVEDCARRPGDCELARTHGASAIRLPAARAVTLTDGTPVLGKGVTVGVMDIGPLHWLNASPDDTFVPGAPGAAPSPTTHSQLPDIPAFGYNPDDLAPDAQVPFLRGDPNESRHPLAVVGIIAAKRDDQGPVGVAPEADFVYGNVNGFLRTPALASVLIDSGASIINNSWTTDYYIAARDFRALDENGNTDMAQTRANLREYLRRTIVRSDEFFSQKGRFARPEDRPIFVWTAGNNNGRRVTAALNFAGIGGPSLAVNAVIDAPSPGILSGLPEFFPELTLNNIAVAAVNGVGRPAVTFVNGEELSQAPIARFSNRCGGNAFCIAAPGVASYSYSGNWVRAEAARLGCPTPADLNGCPGISSRIFAGIIAERYRNGRGGGFVLAPESTRYRQAERYIPAGSGYDIGSGTSFAAPLVSGSLALMRQYFMRGTGCEGPDCGLGSNQLVERLLATADRRGIYADASVYGSGLLDLENALTPQGDLRLMTGRSLREGVSRELGESALTPPGAFGDSLRGHLLSAPFAMFDSMDAPFPVSAAGMLSARAPEGIGARLRALRDAEGAKQNASAAALGGEFRGWVGMDEIGGSLFGPDGASSSFLHSDAFGNPFAALAGSGLFAGMGRGGFALAAFGDSAAGEDVGRVGAIHGLAAEYSFLGAAGAGSAGSAGSGFGLQAGFVRESDSILAGRGLGGFGGIRARTAFAGVRGFGDLRGGWRYHGAAHFGRTASDSDLEDSWWSGSEDLWSGSFSAGLERAGVLRADDALGFRLWQPLRTEGGRMLFRRPTGRTKYGDLTYRAELWSARPSGRELEFSGMYRRGWSDGGFMRLSAGVVRDAGHRRDAGLLGRFLLTAERVF